MRKRAKKLLALLTAVTVTVTGVNVPAAQAAKPKVSASKTTLYYNGTSAEKKATVTVKNVKGKKVTYSISKAGKKIVKLGDVSGNKTKKFTVTAKKKGTAKVTVKVAGKKVKTIKFTVKKKAAKATPTPTAAPTVAPTDAPSAAPTDAPTVAPTDAPTDAPTATPSVAPTETPEPEASKVTEIKITSEEALTSKDGTKAYVTYDVFDQYKKSMRESTSIKWSTSPANPIDDRTNGQLEFTKGGTDKFNYGEIIVVTGVYAQTGVTVTAQLKVGMARALNTVDFKGYLGSDDATKILEVLPDTFGDGIKTYSMLFKAVDQNGAVIDLKGGDFATSDVTFVSDNPLLAGVDNSAISVKTIKGEDYLAVPLTQGMYADKGGVVNVTAISQVSGTKTPISITIGSTGVLGSLEISAPTKSVYDGDQGIKLPYVAKDTAGNETTDYKTIVRSTNNLILNVTEGQIKIAEANDGSAVITWSDKYQRTDSGKADYAYAPANKSCYDGIDRTISISTVVVGGGNSYNTMSVKDAPVPQKVVGSDKMFAGNTTGQVWTIAKKGWPTWAYVDMSIKNNYGLTMPAPEAYEFMKYSENKGNAVNGKAYEFFKGTIKNPSADKAKYADDSWTIAVNALDEKKDPKAEDRAWTESFGIVTKEGTDPKTFASAAAVNSVEVIPVKELGNVAIDGLDKVIEYDSTTSDWSGTSVTNTLDKAAEGTWKFLVDDGAKGKYYINTVDTGAASSGNNLFYDSVKNEFVSYASINWVAHTADWGATGSQLPDTTIQAVIDAVNNTTSQGYKSNGNKKASEVDNKTYKVNTTLVPGVNEASFTVRSCVGDAAKYSVTGLYKGTKLTIPESYYDIDASSQISTGLMIPVNTIAKTDAVDLKNSHDGYIQYKKFVAKLALKVSPYKGDAVVVKKNVTGTLEAQEITSVTANTNIAAPSNTVVSCTWSDNHAVDQYGYNVAKANIEMAIANYVESTDARLTFKSGVQIGDMTVKGAEIGDKFDVIVTVTGTDVSTKLSYTLGADTEAYITSDSDAADKGLVKALKN